MARISIDNGRTYYTAADIDEILPTIYAYRLLDTIYAYMDYDVRERVHYISALCTDKEFLCRYLELATEDLVIG